MARECGFPTMRKNIRETMSKWNYVIGVREPISGDGCPRR